MLISLVVVIFVGGVLGGVSGELVLICDRLKFWKINKICFFIIGNLRRIVLVGLRLDFKMFLYVLYVKLLGVGGDF